MNTNLPTSSFERRRPGRVLLAVLSAAALAAVALVAPASGAQTAAPGVRATAGVSVEVYSDKDPSALTAFRGALSPYGAWVDDAAFGTVWVPDAKVVGAGFVPYQTGGHWALNERGEWMWRSTYAWGHVAFHYGRWTVLPARGWVWVPGRTYAPAWVVWRLGDPNHVGWAPMPPAFRWVDGRALALPSAPAVPYVFVPAKHVFREKLGMYVVRDADVAARVTARSHDYRPAGVSARTPASPSLTVAHVPAWAAPRSSRAEDPRAIALAAPKVTDRAHAAQGKATAAKKAKAPVAAQAKAKARMPVAAQAKSKVPVAAQAKKAKVPVAGQVRAKVAAPGRAKAPAAGQVKSGLELGYQPSPATRGKPRRE
jgi:hypothetical protein